MVGCMNIPIFQNQPCQNAVPVCISTIKNYPSCLAPITEMCSVETGVVCCGAGLMPGLPGLSGLPELMVGGGGGEVGPTKTLVVDEFDTTGLKIVNGVAVGPAAPPAVAVPHVSSASAAPPPTHLYEHVQVIGCGTFATVYALGNGRVFKKMKFGSSARPDEQLLIEAAFLKTFCARQCGDITPQLHEVSARGIVMDVGEVLCRITPRSCPASWFRVGVVRSVLRALISLHRQGFYHGDIKPNNIVWIQKESGGVQARLIDFGITSCEAQLYNASYGCGTFAYLAPELALADYDSGLGWPVDADAAAAADVFAAAWTLLHLFIPYKSCLPVTHGANTRVARMMELVSILGTPTEEHFLARCPQWHAESYPKVPSRKLSEYPPMREAIAKGDVPADLADLLDQMTNMDPRLRPTAEDIAAHPFLAACRGQAVCQKSTPSPSPTRRTLPYTPYVWGVTESHGVCADEPCADASARPVVVLQLLQLIERRAPEFLFAAAVSVDFADAWLQLADTNAVELVYLAAFYATASFLARKRVPVLCKLGIKSWPQNDVIALGVRMVMQSHMPSLVTVADNSLAVHVMRLLGAAASPFSQRVDRFFCDTKALVGSLVGAAIGAVNFDATPEYVFKLWNTALVTRGGRRLRLSLEAVPDWYTDEVVAHRVDLLRDVFARK